MAGKRRPIRIAKMVIPGSSSMRGKARGEKRGGGREFIGKTLCPKLLDWLSMTTQNLLSANDSGSTWPAGEESWMEREDGKRLFIRAASPAIARAVVIVTHGLGEHSNRYGHIAKEFVSRGWRTVSWD